MCEHEGECQPEHPLTVPWREDIVPLPLGLEQVTRDVSHKTPIAPQLARSQSPPSARGVLFVCSSPKCSLGSRQIKSQLSGLGGGGRCGLCWLAGGFPGRQCSSWLRAPGRAGTCCSHTARPEHRCYPGGSHGQTRTATLPAAPVGMLTIQPVSSARAFGSFCLICSTRQCCSHCQ